MPLQKAFSGPLELRKRIGTLDPGKIAAMDPSKLEQAFRERPALHRFPGNMARRVQDLAGGPARTTIGAIEVELRALDPNSPGPPDVPRS